MSYLYQHPDGLITVHLDEQRSIALPADIFRQHYGKAAPTLPAGITAREYEPGKHHSLKNGSDIVGGGPVPWPEGDAIIARAPALIAAEKTRAEKALAQQRDAVKARIDAEEKQARARVEAEMQEAKRRLQEATVKLSAAKKR